MKHIFIRGVFNAIVLVAIALFPATVNADPPGRIVSLAPSITELLYELGLDENIAAVTNFCDYPPAALKKPKIGGMSNPSLEAIVSIRPDIVIVTMDGNPKGINKRLGQLGIRTYVFKAKRISELPDAILEVGRVLDVQEEAGRLSKSIKDKMEKYRSLRRKRLPPDKQHERRKAVFIIWPEPLVVAGKGTAIDDVLTLLGWTNIASSAASRYPKYSIEDIILQSPDVIFVGEMRKNTKELSEQVLKKLSMLDAVKNGRVYYTSDALYRLGPRVVEGTEELATYLLKE
jgi:iron complex transport system substrate-binding protein